MAMAQTIFKQGIVQKLRDLILPQSNYEEQYCRLCLSSCDTEFKDIFSPFNATRSVVEVIEDFTKVTISPKDEYSKLICIICFIKLAESENFKDLIINTDMNLRNRPTKSIDPLQVDPTGNNEVIYEDSDHEKIDVEEIDLKQDTKLLSEDCLNNPIVTTYELMKNEEGNLETTEKDVEITEDLNKHEEGEQDEAKADKDEILMQNDNSKIEIKNLSVAVKVKKKYTYQLKCPKCDKVFKRYADRKLHLINKHTKNYPFHCSTCNRGFAIRGPLIIHEKRQIGQKNYQCEVCGKSFVDIFELRAHKRSHEDEKPFKCDQYTKEYKHKKYLTVHIASAHSSNSDQPSFVCAICKRTYRTLFHLRVHERRSHKYHKLITCEICGESVEKYSHHIKKHTSPYKCDVCSQSFSSERFLKEHSRRHTGAKLYECDICKKTFEFTSTLFRHKKSHNKTSQKNASKRK